MAKTWDEWLHTLVQANPQAFLDWIILVLALLALILILTDLTGAGQDQLALVGFSLAALVLKRQDETELDWLIGRFRTMHDLLQENPIYQEILREGKEKGLQQGLQEGAIKALRQAVVEMTQAHRPELADLAKEKVQHLSDPAALRQLLIRISWTTDVSQARQILMEITDHYR